jgi:queuine tRNA-ribosyltransferase
MPVGTQATVKTVTPDELEECGAQIILGNTYHLSLRPGAERIAALGGLHTFMGWPRAILTDSGGFQVFSLGHLRRVTDEGVEFRSHIDGAAHFFSPERVIQLEEWLGADIIMPLDECLGFPMTEEDAARAAARTLRWAERSLAARTRPDQQLFGIVQGGVYAGLREACARDMAALPFPGYAIGGLSIGEAKDVMHAMIEVVVPLLPSHKPRYLMGVGAPEDLWEGVARGIDMFDVVLPTRIARNGALLTRQGRLNIRNSVHATSTQPIEDGCPCYTCRRFTLAYLHHLFRAEEMLGYRLATLHNLTFMLNLAAEIRQSIVEGRFIQARASFLAAYRPPDETVREEQRARWLAAREARETR